MIGGGGQLGTKIQLEGNERHEISATYLTRKSTFNNIPQFQVDKTEKDKIQRLIKRVKPDAVIDTAALHNVDYCETHKDEARNVNVVGTLNVAEACASINAKMIFVSTDYVFDGESGLYRETDNIGPVNYYGQSKYEGEVAVINSCTDYAITRTSVIYSYMATGESQSSSGKPLNFAMWLMQKLARGEAVRVVTDQYNSPTLADNLAQALLGICEKDITGVYHVAGKTRISRYGFAVKIARKMGYDETLIRPVDSASLNQVAKRPRDSSLNVSKVEGALGKPMLKIDEALQIFYNQVYEGKGR